MTTIPLAYCAAPYAGDEAENFRRADVFALTVAMEGRAVLLPHRAIGRQAPDVPEAREAALTACLAAVDSVWYRGGEMHVLLRDDGELSAGCEIEVARWRERGGAEIRWRWDEGRVVRT